MILYFVDATLSQNLFFQFVMWLSSLLLAFPAGARRNYRKNYRKPINRYFSNYRQKYRYRFKTSSNYRRFEEIIGKVIDIEIDSKIIKKLSLSKKMTYVDPSRPK